MECNDTELISLCTICKTLSRDTYSSNDVQIWSIFTVMGDYRITPKMKAKYI